MEIENDGFRWKKGKGKKDGKSNKGGGCKKDSGKGGKYDAFNRVNMMPSIGDSYNDRERDNRREPGGKVRELLDKVDRIITELSIEDERAVNRFFKLAYEGGDERLETFETIRTRENSNMVNTVGLNLMIQPLLPSIRKKPRRKNYLRISD